MLIVAVEDDGGPDPAQAHQANPEGRGVMPGHFLVEDGLHDRAGSAAAHFLGPTESQPAFIEKPLIPIGKEPDRPEWIGGQHLPESLFLPFLGKILFDPIPDFLTECRFCGGIFQIHINLLIYC